jgi:hypothetical protein
VRGLAQVKNLRIGVYRLANSIEISWSQCPPLVLYSGELFKTHQFFWEFEAKFENIFSCEVVSGTKF